MTELELYKWVKENNPEWKWDFNDNKEPDVLIWISHYLITSFLKMLGAESFSNDESSFPVWLIDDGICLYMNQICERWDIELENVFSKS